MFGKKIRGSDQRAMLAKRFVQERSPYAIVAGVLGVFAPIDGLIFFPLTIAAIVVGFIGWIHIRKNPPLKGVGLCVLGILGGTIGFALMVILRLL